jgi:hypothetical protein
VYLLGKCCPLVAINSEQVLVPNNKKVSQRNARNWKKPNKRVKKRIKAKNWNQRNKRKSLKISQNRQTTNLLLMN